ncbi:MAG: gamma-glutamyltransferase family protein [Actinomycetota bacterium]
MFTTRPELLGTYGMVSSTHWLASSAGMAVLERGGNAFDAAVAAGLVLQVVESHLNGPGGEVSIVLYGAEQDEALVVCGQGVAPKAATIEHFKGLGLELVPGTGLLPACVPGAFDAWMLLLLELGTFPLRSVMEQAIAYAGGGYPLVPRISGTIAVVQDLFAEEWRSSAEIYLPDGRVPAPGTIFRNPSLAATYARIVDEAEAAASDRNGQIEEARRLFYRGFVAEAIDDFCRNTDVIDVSGKRNRGILTADDLAAWQATREPPIAFDYADHRVFKTGPWGQGPVFLQQLSLLEGFDLATMAHNGADYVHTVVECAKLAFADREAWYGDPAMVDVPLDALLDDRYVRQRRELVSDRASWELRPGAPDGRDPRLMRVPKVDAEGAWASSGAGEPTVARTGESGGDTCQIDVVDRWGNLVAATPSGGWLQSSPVIPGLGFCLGTRGQMFWLEEGLPNSLAPQKRPRTTLTPTIAIGERERLAFGTPGGDTQDQWSLNFFLAHVHFGLNLQEAIDAPMFHTTHFPSSFFPRSSNPGQIVVEGRFDADVVRALEERGHEVVVEEDWSLGRLSAVGYEPQRGVLKAAANPRGMQGYAVGR